MEPFRLNFRHLRASVAIARFGTISAAAREVHLTQPAITQGLAKLEAEIGERLFERGADGMTPTEAARIVVPRFATAIDLIGNPRVTAVQARAFLEVTKAGGYAAAARRTGLSNASLHRAVSDLAIAYGYPLIERRGDGVMTTRRGREVVRRLSLARGELTSALDELAARAGRKQGRIAIGAMPLCRARLLPTALRRFTARHPDFSIAVVEGSRAELVDPLRNGELDIMIGALRHLSVDDELHEVSLFDDRPVVVARAGHPLASRTPTIADLARYPWTIAAVGAPLRDHWETMFTEAATSPPRVPIECGSVMTIRELLLDSDFLALLSPDQVAAELQAGWLSIVCEAPPSVIRTIGVTTRRGWRPTALQQSLLDELVSASKEPRSQISMARR